LGAFKSSKCFENSRRGPPATQWCQTQPQIGSGVYYTIAVAMTKLVYLFYPPPPLPPPCGLYLPCLSLMVYSIHTGRRTEKKNIWITFTRWPQEPSVE
jgi:hypothetical protein